MKERIAMPRRVVLLFSLLIVLDVLVWSLQKHAVLHIDLMGDRLGLARQLVRQPSAWLALMIAPVQLLLWTNVLAHAEISLAYPMTSIGYPVTMLVAVLWYHEKLSVDVWIGALLITAGVWLLLSRPKASTA